MPVYKRFVSVMYVLNIVFQAFITLAAPIFLGLGISWLLVRYLSAPEWIYAPITVFGVLSGLWSMVKFVLSGMASLERLEKERNSKDDKNNTGNNI